MEYGKWTYDVDNATVTFATETLKHKECTKLCETFVSSCLCG